MRFAMGMWLKHSGMAALGSSATSDGLLPAIEGRRGGWPGLCAMDCCSWLPLASCLPPLEACLAPLPASCFSCAAAAAAATAAGDAAACFAAFSAALRAAFSAFCFAFNSAFESLGWFASVEGEVVAAAAGAGSVLGADVGVSAGVGGAPWASVAML